MGASCPKLRAGDDGRRQAKRNKLGDKLTVEAKVLADLVCEGERRTVEADFGPPQISGDVLGADDEAVLRWSILAVALLLDPAAALLLLAASARR